ncbi:hypothetical protein HDV06_004913 [Boothiomyces sp. JEL0866]|nr:hypothetical protein HDV06_004913 [Boothiomyces sp. JEL0866]
MKISLVLISLAVASPLSMEKRDTPTVEIQRMQDKGQTGGSFGCFGFPATGNNRIKEILQLTPGTGVKFYSQSNCKSLIEGLVFTSTGTLPDLFTMTDIQSLRLVPITDSPNDNSQWDSNVKGYSPSDSLTVQLQLTQTRVETGGNIGCFGINAVGPNRLQQVTKIPPGFQLTFYRGFNCQKKDLINDVVQTQAGWVDPIIANSDILSIRLKPIGTSQRYSHEYGNV